jgi:hypothetical protein
MNIGRYNTGTFVPSEFDMTAVIANEFISLISMQNVQIREGIQYYFKPSFEKYLIKSNTLKNIKEAFETAQTARKIEINNRVFFIAKGVFFSEIGVPLMVCAMKKEAFLNESIARFTDFRSTNFSYNNYVLFYSTSFFTDPGLAPLNRRLQKEILLSCYEKGIEVRIISSSEIERNTFARLFEVKKTKSLTQLEIYMNQVLPNFLHTQGEDTFVEQEFEPVMIYREGLSVEEEALLFDDQSTIIEAIVPPPIVPNRQLTLEEARELAELEIEAAQFDPPSEFSEEDYTDEEYNEDRENNEQEEDEEEIERHEQTAHTVYPYMPSESFIGTTASVITNTIPSIELIDDME